MRDRWRDREPVGKLRALPAFAPRRSYGEAKAPTRHLAESGVTKLNLDLDRRGGASLRSTGGAVELRRAGGEFKCIVT